MQADKYKDYTAIDFLEDDDFLRWQLIDDNESRSYWGDVIEKYPPLASIIEEAVDLFKDNIRINDFRLSNPEVSERLNSLQKKICNEKKRKFRSWIFFGLSSVVATSVAIVIFSFPFFTKNSNVQDISTFTQALSLFQDHHSHENAYGSVRRTVIRTIKDTENTLVYTRYNVFTEHVMPGVVFLVVLQPGAS